MYCINCGVKLADTEKCCTLCDTAVFHPDLVRQQAEPLYPPREPAVQVSSRVGLTVLTTMVLMAACIVALCDVQINGTVRWSGYVIGALGIFYVAFLLPGWFRRPNPVVFVPCTFLVIGVYLLYINWHVGGDWFLSFAFPVTGGLGLIVTAVVTLLKYLPRGALYIIGGALITLGAFVPVMELLLCVTFSGVEFLGWSFYPLIALALLGGMLIFLAISRIARENMQRKFFI